MARPWPSPSVPKSLCLLFDCTLSWIAQTVKDLSPLWHHSLVRCLGTMIWRSRCPCLVRHQCFTHVSSESVFDHWQTCDTSWRPLNGFPEWNHIYPLFPSFFCRSGAICSSYSDQVLIPPHIVKQFLISSFASFEFIQTLSSSQHVIIWHHSLTLISPFLDNKIYTWFCGSCELRSSH